MTIRDSSTVAPKGAASPSSLSASSPSLGPSPSLSPSLSPSAPTENEIHSADAIPYAHATILEGEPELQLEPTTSSTATTIPTSGTNRVPIAVSTGAPPTLPPRTPVAVATGTAISNNNRNNDSCADCCNGRTCCCIATATCAVIFLCCFLPLITTLMAGILGFQYVDEMVDDGFWDNIPDNSNFDYDHGNGTEYGNDYGNDYTEDQWNATSSTSTSSSLW
eukprot:CAMPEP_0172357768 /NCGR_PEP_ID=MMETSP1060-20121228/2094_1 /TAXON_ID=37318 /ORGANISM="Pseudo-nitzschia pungens, Strain cf. cingulata" /LENGTH=220 /DNA_ID=CAMNT_0013078583 /DNA_START=138 /DNA_END=797 /DNA_ORIENTATION=+